LADSEELDGYTGMPLEILKEWEDDFHNTFFTTPSGLRTFTWLLEECGFFDLTETEEDIALNNFAKKLLYVANVMRPQKAAQFVEGVRHGG